MPKENTTAFSLGAVLVAGLRADQRFQEQLRALRDAHLQQLQEAQRRQCEELEKRIHRDSLLSADMQEDTPEVAGVDLNPSSGAHPTQRTTTPITQPSYVHKQLESEVECRKQFRALPVPSHVGLPLYHRMTQLREARRKQCLDQRKDFLLSTQKPFSFQERERERRDKLVESKGELRKKVSTRHNREPIKSSTAPDGTRNAPASVSKPRCSERTKKQILGFLDEKPSFKPKISQEVPDFNSRHKAFQAETLRKMKSKDSTKCQPFRLWTSTLSIRQSTAKPVSSQEPKVSNHLRKSKSFGCLTSLSAETLPTYISDTTRKRGMAIRKTLEMNERKKGESADWMRSFQRRSQAMQKTVTLRAKVTDPHSSLKDVCHEQLQRHREADQQRVSEYMKELREMKERVTQRPYLFEQVKQKHAKVQVERTFRKKLQEAGVNEQFVEATS
ncbi:hypothetical protein CRUP_033163 [Coryphaenoides rupestris]|nr:hypothetical protein CRUP_033163 [Coryphaenoides rupestris]